MRIALISDIHGNYQALEAVLGSEEFNSTEEAYCLGDLVGYYPYPEECVTRIKQERIVCVMGNHDYSCVENKPCYDNETGRLSLEITRKLVSLRTIDFLSKLPRKLEIELNNKRLYLVHGSPANLLNGYINPQDDVEVPAGFDLLATGHTHIQFSRRIASKLIVNPGSVGQPRDGIKGACLAVLDLEETSVSLTRVNYDASEVITRTAGLKCYEAADSLRQLFEGSS